MPTLTRTVTAVVVCILGFLTALSYTNQSAFAQTSQHRETDLDFTSRLRSQSANLQKQVNGLDIRLKKLEQAAASREHILLGRQIPTPASTNPGSRTTTAALDERRVPETLRHRDRAVDQSDLGIIRSELQSLNRQIQEEQSRLSANRAQQSRSIEANLQRLQQQVRALDAKLGNVERAARQ